jgi:hypothetical protein
MTPAIRMTPKALFNMLVSSQAFNGSWASSHAIMKSLGSNETSEMKEITRGFSEDVVATLLAIGCLERYCQSFSWDLIFMKAIKYLRSATGKEEQELTAIAAKLLQTQNIVLQV